MIYRWCHSVNVSLSLVFLHCNDRVVCGGRMSPFPVPTHDIGAIYKVNNMVIATVKAGMFFGIIYTCILQGGNLSTIS